MANTPLFQMRLASADRQRLRDLAARAQRSESEVVRLLLRQADLTRVSTGLPPLTLHTEAPSAPGPATTEAKPWREAVLA